MEDFLVTVWFSGARLGTKPEEAFVVRSDRTTMTQNDPDNGRMICVIVVAPTYPSEYVIFRTDHGPPTRRFRIRQTTSPTEPKTAPRTVTGKARTIGLEMLDVHVRLACATQGQMEPFHTKVSRPSPAGNPAEGLPHG